MCIHEQLETLHSTMQLIWKRTKWGCPQKLFCHLCFSSKQGLKRIWPKKKNPLEVLMFIIFLQWTSYAPPQNKLHQIEEVQPGFMQIWQAACTCWEEIRIFKLHLDALYCLVDVFHQGFVLWNLILLLVGVDVCQCGHIVLKVLLTDGFLQHQRQKKRTRYFKEMWSF